MIRASAPVWAADILFSALTLGLYDVCKKHAVQRNAVMTVLFLATLCGSLACVGATLLAGQAGAALAIGRGDFLRVLLKTLIVTGSWICIYYAMRALPISFVAPLRASAPLWTLLGAVLLYREVPSAGQALGMALVFGGYWRFARLGRREGIVFSRSPAILLAFAGTLLGAASALYDKHLLQPCGLPRVTMQFWFSIDLVVVLGAGLLLQRAAGLARTPFVWRASIPALGLLLIVSDWLYFRALSHPDVPVSILSLLRRSGVAVSFTLGACLFGDANPGRKAWALALLLAGVAVLCLA